MEELWDAFDDVLSARSLSNPWKHEKSGRIAFQPDYDTLAQLVSIPIAAGSASQTGRLAKAIDAWTAQELRRGGFNENEVWPRRAFPKVLPRDLALFLEKLPKSERDTVQKRILKNKQVAPSEAHVLGKAYLKQIDVLISQWSRGPELIVSTKSMVSSFRKNLPNRFEEAYGDAQNLRGRYPLASMGFLFVMRSTAADEPGTLDRAYDMLRKLCQDSDVYDKTSLIVCEWQHPPRFENVAIRNDLVPQDLQADAFLANLIENVLERTPIDMHVPVRERREKRDLPV